MKVIQVETKACIISLLSIASSYQGSWPINMDPIDTSDTSDTLIIAWVSMRVIIEVKGHQHWWLAGRYNLE